MQDKKNLYKIDLKVIRQNRIEQLKIFGKRFLRNKVGMIGGSIVLIIVFIALFAPFLAPYDPAIMDTQDTFASPSTKHLLGTDQYGRDVLSRIIYGSRISVQVGFISVIIAAILGILIGAFAGFYGGYIDNILMRIMDALFSFPALLLALTFVAILGPSMINATIAIGIIYTPIVARVIRSSVISNKEEDYVEAARALGQSNFKLLFLDIIPNGISPLVVIATVMFADAIVIEAGLSFIGLGVPPPTPSWGIMLSNARGFMDSKPLLAIFPGVSISLSVLGFNLLGDGLRDLLDPRLRRFKA